MATLGHSDAPIEALDRDRLNVRRYAESLARFIASCPTPMTIAVQGDWGMGKTTLMHMVQKALEAEPNGAALKPIWFNTWQYSQFDTHAFLAGSLLASLLRKLSGGDQGRIKEGLRIISRLARPVVNTAVRAGSAGALELDDFLPFGREGETDPAKDAEALKEKVAEAVRTGLPAGGRFVIFVDDLDRIIPERAVEVLEVIKLFLDLPGCVFVLALDRAVVERGVQKRFGIDSKEINGRSFFDKIIQLPFTVPDNRSSVRDYVVGLLKSSQPALSEEDGELFTRLLAASVSTNPRGIKRVLNSLQLLLLVAEREGHLPGGLEDRIRVRILFALLCLQLRFPTVYAWLVGLGDKADEETILSFEKPAGAEISEVLRRMGEADQEAFGQFAKVFVEAVQTPGEDMGKIDDHELERLRRVLTLSRITASGEAEPEPELSEADRDFRRQARDAEREVQNAIRQALAQAGLPEGELALYQSHGVAWAETRRPVRNWEVGRLRLRHDRDSIELYLRGAKVRMRTAKAMLDGSSWTADPSYAAGEDRITLVHRPIAAELSFAERAALLKTEFVPRFVDAIRFFEG